MSSDQFKIRITDDEGARVLTLSGELDLASAPQLQRAFDRAEASGSRHVVVDLSGLEFIDSSGLRLLVAAHRRSRENGHRLSLLRGPRAVHHVFELTQTESLFEFDD
jgi:anti-sigma B factor antagonist